MSNHLSLTNRLLPVIDRDYLPSPSSNQEQFLRLNIVPDTTALLPIQQVAEVVTIPIEKIVPIAHMPPWVMGVYNWRSEMLWMVDLGHLIGFSPWYQQRINRSIHEAIIVHIGVSRSRRNYAQNKILGLIINQVDDIDWCNPDEIQSPPASAIMPQLQPFLRGYWMKPNGEMLVVLDGAAIVARMPKQS